jgi:2-hydroxychromene-2-carboxylate isomerase
MSAAIKLFLSSFELLLKQVSDLQITDKDKWINVERARWAKAFSIPMNEKTPEGFPPLTLTIMRALCALTVLHPGEEGQEPLTKCLDSLYYAFWVEHKKTNEKEVLAEVLSSVLGKEETEKGEWFWFYLGGKGGLLMSDSDGDGW